MPPPARPKAGGEAGLSLIEVLVTVVILGVAFVTIIGGMTVSIAGSDIHRKQATSQTVLRNLAEYLKSDQVVYEEGCSADYNDDLAEFLGSVPAGYEVSIDEVRHLRYSGEPSPGTPVVAEFDGACDDDNGVQQITLAVRSSVRTGLVEELHVVKRQAL